MRTSTSDWI